MSNDGLKREMQIAVYLRPIEAIALRKTATANGYVSLSDFIRDRFVLPEIVDHLPQNTDSLPISRPDNQ